MASSTTSPKQWHVGNWTGLGWLETGIKLVAQVAAFIALANALQDWTAARLEGVRYFQAIILGIMALGLTVAIVDRYIEKEIIAMIFILINVAAHWSMFFAMFRQPEPGPLLDIFAALMLLGDLIKIVFLVRTKFTVRGYNPRLLLYLTGSVVMLEAILLVLSVIKNVLYAIDN